jgi:hypothetical protein
MKNIFKKQIRTFSTHCDWKVVNNIISKYCDDDFNKLSDSEKEKFLLKIINQNKEKLDITVKIKHLNRFQLIFQETMMKIINFLTKINY